MKINQPAFPTGIVTDDKGKMIGGSNGMSLRDYFAAKAMQANIGNFTNEYDLVRSAYTLADKMLEEREK